MDVRGCVRGIGRVAGDVDTAVWVVWAGALLAYLVGVMHRTSSA
jgi:hypothetical protein